MYRALYRKWRPQTFDDVHGQEQVTDILKFQVDSGRTSHAYLFCGSRGTGKTSCAKILAKAVNCLDPRNGNPCNECAACKSIDAGISTDVIEMDAASNNGVDNVRDLKEEIVYTPAELKYRVYIIDEVHMMSGSAFNALLKTLEEPPSYVLFILATTEMNKLPATIISRCQRYDFRRLTSDVLIGRLNEIAAAEGIRLTDSGARLISRMAQGGMRDAISLLELCAATGEEIDEALASRILGIGGRDVPGRLVDAVLSKDYPVIYRLVADIVASSQDLAVFWGELIEYYRDLTVVKNLPDAKAYLDLTDGEYTALSDRAARIPMAKLLHHSRLLEETHEALRRSASGKRSIAEMALVRMCEPKLSATPEAMLARLEDLEKQVARLRVSLPGDSEQAPVSVSEEGPSKKAAKAKEEPQAVKAAPSASEIKEKAPRTEQALAVWGSVVEELGEVKPSIRPFFNGSTATVSEDGAVTVTLTVGLFLNMVSADTASQTMLLNLLREKGVQAASIRFISAVKKKKDGQIEF